MVHPDDLSSGEQQSKCQTLPRTSYDPGPVPPESSTLAPRRTLNACAWKEPIEREKSPEPMRKRKFVMITRKIVRAEEGKGELGCGGNGYYVLLRLANW